MIVKIVYNIYNFFTTITYNIRCSLELWVTNTSSGRWFVSIIMCRERTNCSVPWEVGEPLKVMSDEKVAGKSVIV